MQRLKKKELREFANICFAFVFAIPAAFVAINLLLQDDMRYWPSEVPTIYAKLLGFALLILSSVLLWVSIRKSKST